ncbi:MAG: beta-lactamase family protein [Myxococcales bacterium]|nr:beta-lactamase family protein [Myxococcales bacterium]
MSVPPNDLAEATRALLANARARGVFSAAVASVGDEGTELLTAAEGTLAQGEPAPCTTHTMFDLASVTKPMATAMLAMALVSEGQLTLATPAVRYLGGIDPRITLAQLLGHAAGFPAHIEFFRAMWQGETFSATAPHESLIAGALAQPLAYAPGTQTIYSDLGYILLGAMLERAAGMRLDEAFAALVAQPLGWDSARFVAHDRGERIGTDDVAATEIDERRGCVRGEVHDENCHAGGGVAGHAGLFARVADVANFAQVTLALAHGTDQGRIASDVARTFYETSAAPGTSWRLGWDTPATTPGVSHAGDLWPRAGALGHLGFTGTSIWLDLAKRRWAVLLSNRVHPSRLGERAAAIKDVRREFADAVVTTLG